MFISLEGIDGSGKSEISARVVARLNELNHPAILISKSSRFTNSILSRRLSVISNLLWEYTDINEVKESGDYHLITLVASYYHLLHKILLSETVKSNKIAISDGWKYKNLIRFSLKSPDIRSISQEAMGGVPDTDFSVFLDASPQLSARRKSSFSASECGIFDGYHGNDRENFISYQNRVATRYKQLAELRQWTIVDASYDPDEIVDDVVNAVLERSKSE